jgi:TolB-like protein/DNA-binding winged helix-turn-helix (wHTH) protein/tetratricopeptide (TPR) repeat protein
VEGDFRIGQWLVQPTLNSISDNESSKRVEPKMMQVLVHLAAHAGQVVSKEQLMGAAWPDTFVTDDVLLRCISELRKALSDDPREPRFIQTIAKKGYRLIAPVEWMDRSSEAASGVEPSAGRQVAPGDLRPGRRVLLIGFATSLVLALLAVAYFSWHRWVARPGSGQDKSVLLVLPFQNLSADAEQEYFSDGLTEEMITQLARLQPERLAVIARTSSMHYKGTNKTIDEIGRELGVHYILEGTVRREGKRVRISAQLIRASDQAHVWADSYDRELSGILAVQNEVAQAVAREIRITLSAHEQTRLASSRPVVAEAHEAYLRGRFFWNKRTPEGLRKAIEHFERAIEIDPGYAAPYTGLADAHLLLLEHADTPPEQDLPKARTAALKALEIDSDLAEAHTSVAMIKFCQDWDWAGAEEGFQRAVSLNPNYVTAHHWYALLMATTGRLDEARAEIERAVKLDSLSSLMRTAAGWRVYAAARQYEQAAHELRLGIELDPLSGTARRRLGAVYVLTGKHEEAIAELREGVRLSGGTPIAQADLGHAYGVAGMRAEARKVLDELRQLSRSHYVDATRFALIYTGLGEKDRAMEWLEKAYQRRDMGLIMLPPDPRFDPLRNDPRYQSLLRRMKLP